MGILYYNSVGNYLHVGGFISDLFLWGVFRVVVDVVAWRFSFEVGVIDIFVVLHRERSFLA